MELIHKETEDGKDPARGVQRDGKRGDTIHVGGKLNPPPLSIPHTLHSHQWLGHSGMVESPPVFNSERPGLKSCPCLVLAT